MICYFNREIFKNSDTGFNIMVYETKDGSVPAEARSGLTGDVFSFTAKGFNLPVTPGVEIELDGKWIDGKYGLQLDVTSFIEKQPTSKSGIIGYLSSGLIIGIGEKSAEAIYERFKDKTLDVLEHTPEKLLEIKGITPQKLELIKQSYNDSRAVKDIVSFLSPYGISANKAVKIKKAFGANAYSIIKTNPFTLCSISGFGFATVDKIARKVNCSLTEPLRLTSGVKYVLEQAAATHGHLFLHASEVCNEAHTLLNDGFPNEIVSMAMVQKAINSLVKSKDIAYEKNYKALYLRRKYTEEMCTALAVAGFLTEQIQGVDISKHIKQAQKELNILLSPDQLKAVKMSFEHNLSIITGGPGTGKTTILKVILYIYGIVFKEKTILLAAPTGRASRRMAESTGHSEAFTLHSALGLVADDENSYMNDGEDLDADFIVVDEMSMVDMFLAHELFTRIKKGTKILLVGDADQLPSIGAGNVFRELLSCDVIPKTKLSMIYRQANESLIPVNAHSINEGGTNLQYGSNFEFIECENDEEANSIVTERYVSELEHLNIQDIQVLTPRKDKVKSSAKEINEIVRELVNPIRPPNRQINVGKRSFRVNDRVMQIKNVAPISNGDIGVITNIGKDEDGKDIITIDFDGRVANYHTDKMDIIVHSYAVTIHKSQGSEYEVVIIPLLTSSYIMLRRNLIYTAITRAKRKVVLVGQKNALAMAIRKNDIDKRNTFLGFRINADYKRKFAEITELNKRRERNEQLKLHA